MILFLLTMLIMNDNTLLLRKIKNQVREKGSYTVYK